MQREEALLLPRLAICTTAAEPTCPKELGTFPALASPLHTNRRSAPGHIARYHTISANLMRLEGFRSEVPSGVSLGDTLSVLSTAMRKAKEGKSKNGIDIESVMR